MYRSSFLIQMLPEPSQIQQVIKSPDNTFLVPEAAIFELTILHYRNKGQSFCSLPFFFLNTLYFP